MFNSRAPARALACVASTRGVNMSYRREWVGDAPPRGGDDSRADFSAWERKVLLLTDQLCTRLTLTLHVVAMPFLFGPWAARPVTSLADDLSRVWSNALVTATLVALAWVMRARRAWYEANRVSIVVTVRSLTLAFLLMGYVHSGAWDVSRPQLVISRLFWGVWGTVGWQVDNLLSLVVQLAFFVFLRMSLALKESALDEIEDWRCSPMGICSPSAKLPAARRAELELEADFSFSMRGFIFDFGFLVVMPALILLVKKRHSRLMFAVENQRAITSRGRVPSRQGGDRASMSVSSTGSRMTSSIDGDFGLFSQTTNAFKKFWKRTTVWVPLMEFPDPAMEARFEYWHRLQMFTIDSLKCGVSLISSSVFYARVNSVSSTPQSKRFNTVLYFVVNLLQICFMLTQKRTYIQYRTPLIIGLRLMLYANSIITFFGILNFQRADTDTDDVMHFSLEVPLLLGVIQAIGMHLLMRSFIVTFVSMACIFATFIRSMAVGGAVSSIKGLQVSFLLERIGLRFDWFKNKTQTEMFIPPTMLYGLISVLTTFVVESRYRTIFLRIQGDSESHDDARQVEAIRQSRFYRNTASEAGLAEDSGGIRRSVRRRTSTRTAT